MFVVRWILRQVVVGKKQEICVLLAEGQPKIVPNESKGTIRPAGMSKLPGCCPRILRIPCGLGHTGVRTQALQTSIAIADELDRGVDAKVRLALVLCKNVRFACGTRQPAGG